MYFEPFWERNAVNTGVPCPKVPMHRKLGFEGVCWRCLKQHTRLLVTERRREAFIGIGHPGSLHTLHWIVDHGVAFT